MYPGRWRLWQRTSTGRWKPRRHGENRNLCDCVSSLGLRFWSYTWQSDWKHRRDFRYFHCFGRIWKLTVFTILWLPPYKKVRK